MHKHILILLLTLGAVALLAGCPVQKQGSGTQATKSAQLTSPENQAKDFEYTLFDGASHKLSDNFGQPLVVNFWADWCPPCVAELPHFEEVWKEKSGQFNIVAIAVKNAQNPQGFVKDQGFTMPFATDINGADTYGITGIPVTLFIAKDGSLVDQVVGGMDRATFESKLAQIL